MSWDIFVQHIPEGIRSVEEIPADFMPQPLGPRDEITRGIADVFAEVDFTDPDWGHVDGDGYSIEFNIGPADPVTSLALHVRGDVRAVGPIAALLERLECGAFDPQSPTGLFDPTLAEQSMASWRHYRDDVVGPPEGAD